MSRKNSSKNDGNNASRNADEDVVDDGIAVSSSPCNYKDLFCIRTITCFLHLAESDFAPVEQGSSSNNNNNKEASSSSSSGAAAAAATTMVVQHKIALASQFLNDAKRVLQRNGDGYAVQTVRIATNPFGEWLIPSDQEEDAATEAIAVADRMELLDRLLEGHGIEFCAVGPARNREELLSCCPVILRQSHRFSCSAMLHQNDVDFAAHCAQLIVSTSQLQGHGPHVDGGIGNFRFCVAAACTQHSIPFFPVACAGPKKQLSSDDVDNSLHFAIGLENGALAHHLLSECKSIVNIPTLFAAGMEAAIAPIRDLCKQIAATSSSSWNATFMGIDTSLNPSLERPDGSVALAMEQLDEIQCFGGPGTLAAAAAITQALQQIPDHCGYSGLMLPLSEDRRLAALNDPEPQQQQNGIGGSRRNRRPLLSISTLLSISQVCGVGVDTVPIPGDCSTQDLAGLLLDVAGMAFRWNKSLSCRVFPVPGKVAGEWTTFDSPYMVNTRILPLVSDE
jgi:uncharacterized protein